MSDFVGSTLAPALFALLCWWFGTGAILWLVRRPGRSLGLRMTGMSALLLASLWGAWWSMGQPSVIGAYVAFASVIAMWGWHEFAFLSGVITGPRREVLAPGSQGSVRFAQSLQAVLHHELVLAGNLGVLWLLQQGQPSHVALCTFALLWCMRLSAKLNLYFGVREVGAQYLPEHLRYLASYFRSGRISAFFIASVTVALVAWAWVVWLAFTGSVAMSTGWVLLASLLGLAIIEHLLMVFPLPLQRLWGWAMRSSLSRGAVASVAVPAMPVPQVPVMPAVLVTAPIKSDQG